MNLHLLPSAYLKDPLLQYEVEIAGYGGMSVAQAAFHLSPSRKRASISANGIGKTYKGSAEAWWQLLGRHPYRATEPGGTGWVLMPDLRQGWQNISRAMRELEPPGVLDPACSWVPGVGYMYRSRKMIRIADELGGGMLVGKGCKQGLLALEGDRIQWLWVDEPPTQQHWSACRSRVDRTGGPIWLTCTPIGRPVEWLRDMIEGDPDENTEPEPGWWVKHFPLSEENAPHLDAQTIEQMIQGCLPWERGQRIEADWEGYTTGRRFPAFTDAQVIDDEDVERLDWSELRLGMDHGEGATNQLGYLTAICGTGRHARFYVLAEMCPPGAGSSPREVALSIIAGLGEWGLTLAFVTKAYGDANSAGLLGGGGKFNTFVERALADLLQTPETPLHIQIPAKRAGSVDAGEAAMHALMTEGRWFVHKSCRRLIHSYRHYTMKREQDLKNAVDAVRYSVMDELLRWGALPTRTPIRRA